MEYPKVKTWGVPFWTPGTVSGLAWSRTVDSQGHRVGVCVVSEAPLSFMWANYSTFSALNTLCPVLKNRKKKVNITVCTSEIPLPTPVGYFKSELGRLGYYCSSLPTVNLCRPIVLLYLYISRFLVEMSFHLTLRGINHEQKDAVKQPFESNGWPWNVEVTDVCKTESTAHSSRLDDIPRS